ncbi:MULTISPECIES: serine hydrolase domain-containing protein [unclassified Pseudoalteromonas]|uniref:serine hydrolase domain-containing protein n=1 Tax=unclassified Pseudoalteromonas TaxID=194690 RepID=UPI0020981FFF|nr:serine hydrolase domain-containing protein [Pseudoalteromonas sp. XMcav2-N]MCO7189040.1 beta-lactamase family protein [Pseudoalteromonas sp. XMcav2-N]
MGIKTGQPGVWLAMLIWLVSSCGGTQRAVYSEVRQPENGLHRQIDPLLVDLVSDFIPGVSVYIETSGERYYGSAGYADLQTQAPMTSQTRIPNGSAGKKLVGLLGAILDDKELLSLDEPVLPWVPKYMVGRIQNLETMTLRQLLNHSAGIVEYNDVGELDFIRAQLADEAHRKGNRFALQFVLGQPAYFEPGRGFAYSNSGYVLVGMVIENKLKQPLGQLIHEHVLEPLGLTETFVKGYDVAADEVASGYFFNIEEPDFVLPYRQRYNTKQLIVNTALADAPVSSSARDMAKLLKAIVVKKPPVNERIYHNMVGDAHLQTARWLPNFLHAELYYGLGVMVEKHDDGTLYHHGGNEFGYITQSVYLAEQDVAIGLIANCGAQDECDEPIIALTQTLIAHFAANNSD